MTLYSFAPHISSAKQGLDLLVGAYAFHLSGFVILDKMKRPNLIEAAGNC